MRPSTRWSAVLASCAVVTATLGLSSASQAAGQPAVAAAITGVPESKTKAKKVVVVVVDALSREIVEKYGMKNVQQLMADGVDTPRGYLGHLGSVTVVSHNVITSGLLPKHMGWSDDGWRDTKGLFPESAANPIWVPSDWSKNQFFTVQNAVGTRRLPDYLHAAFPGTKVIAVSPKRYAAWAFGGPTADSIITFGSTTTCGTQTYRGPDGVNVPSYIATPCGRYYVHHSSSLTYDTNQYPASLYPTDGDRYVTGHDEDKLGGDVWATDIALETMSKENWSGMLLTLPGVDKAAHMWGGVDDIGGADPMTHVAFAARTADEQVGRVVSYLRDTDQLKDTLLVLTADHGSVAGRSFYGTPSTALNDGYYNWYYGTAANGSYLKPQAALKPLVDTGNVAMSYSDSMLRAWLKDTSAAKVTEAAIAFSGMPAVTGVFVRNGDHYDQFGKTQYANMRTPAEKAWFVQHAQELVDTEAAPYGPEVIATLADNTTYSIAGDHGGIQRSSQQIPIVFYGGGAGSIDLQAPVRSVDILPTVLRRLGVAGDASLDGTGYALPGR